MIFSNFISGAKLEAGEQAAAGSLGLLEGATHGTVSTLRRLVQASSGRLVGKPGGRSKIKSQSRSKSQCKSQRQPLEGELLEEQEAAAAAAAAAPVATEAAQAEPASPESQAAGGEWQLERKYTLKEVEQHNSLFDCWMVIFDKVYNISEFVDEHPGGDFILLEYAGRDATHPFLSSRHGSSAYKMLDKYWIGILVDSELYYSNNSSYCSVYSLLSWRSTPPSDGAKAAPEPPSQTTAPTTSTTRQPGSADTGAPESAPASLADGELVGTERGHLEADGEGIGDTDTGTGTDTDADVDTDADADADKEAAQSAANLHNSTLDNLYFSRRYRYGRRPQLSCRAANQELDQELHQCNTCAQQLHFR